MLIFAAIDATTGDYKVISDLPESQRGLKCNCICSGCGKNLVAKMGKKKAHHFAHQSDADSKGAICIEASLRLLGKALIAKMDTFEVQAGKNPEYHKAPLVQANYLGGVKLYDFEPFSKHILEFNKVSVDKELDGMTSDVFVEAAYGNNQIELNFEICLNHTSSNTRLKKVEDRDITTIEIDLGGLLTENELSIERLAQEIVKPENQRLVYLSDGVKSILESECTEHEGGEKGKLQQDVSSWLERFKERYQNGSPIAVQNNLSQVENIASDVKNRYGRKIYISNLIPKFPKVPRLINVSHVDVHSGNMILNCCFGNNVVPLPILLTDDNSMPLIKDEKNLEILSGSHLAISLRSVLRDAKSTSYFLTPVVTWGKNVKVESWESQVRSVIQEKAQESEKQQREVTKNLVKKLSEPVIAKEPNSQYRSMAAKALGLPVESPVLKHLVQEKFDPVGIFDCHFSDWQYLFIVYEMERDLRYRVDYKKFMGWLQREFGIQINKDCQELMYNVRVAEELRLKVPFKVPFVMFKEYMRFAIQMSKRLKLRLHMN